METRESKSSHTQVKPIKGDLTAVDVARLDQALDACDFLLEHLTPEVSYEVDERWGPEGVSYLSEIPSILLEAYRITARQKYLEGAMTILDHLQRTQMPTGGWTSKIGPDGLEFKPRLDQPVPPHQARPAAGAHAFAGRANTAAVVHGRILPRCQRRRFRHGVQNK